LVAGGVLKSPRTRSAPPPLLLLKPRRGGRNYRSQSRTPLRASRRRFPRPPAVRLSLTTSSPLQKGLNPWTHSDSLSPRDPSSRKHGESVRTLSPNPSCRPHASQRNRMRKSRADWAPRRPGVCGPGFSPKRGFGGAAAGFSVWGVSGRDRDAADPSTCSGQPAAREECVESRWEKEGKPPHGGTTNKPDLRSRKESSKSSNRCSHGSWG
jgi:hypothetical protein